MILKNLLTERGVVNTKAARTFFRFLLAGPVGTFRSYFYEIPIRLKVIAPSRAGQKEK